MCGDVKNALRSCEYVQYVLTDPVTLVADVGCMSLSALLGHRPRMSAWHAGERKHSQVILCYVHLNIVSYEHFINILLYC